MARRINVNGIGCLLGVVLITLRVTGAIYWSWWIVLAPIWIPAVLWVLFLMAVGIGTLAMVREFFRIRDIF